jgi:hypothetical protein
VVGFCAAAAIGIAVLHKGNISRLLAGTETKMELRRRRPARPAGGSTPEASL